MTRTLAAVAVLVLLAGCGGTSQPAPRDDDAVVRGWTEATYAGEYDRAADFFADGAIVQQAQTIVLRTHDDAADFSRSLPCRAKVTGIVHERAGTLLASFDLFPGRDGRCADGGTARVRFFIRNGRIETWRQLPDEPAPSGRTV